MWIKHLIEIHFENMYYINYMYITIFISIYLFTCAPSKKQQIFSQVMYIVQCIHLIFEEKNTKLYSVNVRWRTK